MFDEEKTAWYFSQALVFMRQYDWMANSYVAEFFAHNLWEKLPRTWQECLENVTLGEVARNMLKFDDNKTYGSVWPLSLLSFIATCHALSLDTRQKRKSKEELPAIFKKHIKPKKRHELACLPEVIHEVCKKTNSTKILDVGSGLGHLSRMMAYRYGYDVTAVEMVGHRLPLAEKFDKEIEQELQKLNLQDQRIGTVRHIAKWIDPTISAEEFSKLFHSQETTFQHPLSNTSSEKKYESPIEAQITNKYETASTYKNNTSQNNNNTTNCVLVGLHTCGDLASTMAKVFRNNDVIRGLVSVSCCYMRMSLEVDDVSKNDVIFNDIDVVEKINTVATNCNGVNKNITNNNEDENCNKNDSKINCVIEQTDSKCRTFTLKALHEAYNCVKSATVSTNCSDNNIKDSICEDRKYGFPLSAGLRNLPHHSVLKYKSFETACHFVDDYAQKLSDNSPNLKLHCYRAVMEVFIRRVDPALVLSAVRCKKIKHAASLTFLEYAEKVFERLKINLDIQLLKEIDYVVLLEQWKRVVIYHSLVLMLGPVVESIALMDKSAYLHQHGYSVSLTPVFDPSISPRNLVLTATSQNI